MAHEEERAELQSKLTALISKRFGGLGEDAWSKAFTTYDTDHDGQISGAELENLLSDADVGNFLTRRAWAAGVLEALDRDHSQTLSRAELLEAIAKAKHTSTLVHSSPTTTGPLPAGTTFTTSATGPSSSSSSTSKGDTTSAVVLIGLALGALWMLRR